MLPRTVWAAVSRHVNLGSRSTESRDHGLIGNMVPRPGGGDVRFPTFLDSLSDSGSATCLIQLHGGL